MGLTIGRKVGETIHIWHGEDLITLRVNEICHGKTRINIEAPSNYLIWRGELCDDSGVPLDEARDGRP